MQENLSPKKAAYLRKCAAAVGRANGLPPAAFVTPHGSRVYEVVICRIMAAWLAAKLDKVNGLIVTPRDVATFFGLSRAQGYYLMRRANDIVMLDKDVRRRMYQLAAVGLTADEAKEVNSWLDYAAAAAEKMRRIRR